MKLNFKSQRGFAHPLLVFIVFAVFAAIGLVGWRVQTFSQHNRAQAAADHQAPLVAPRNGGPVLLGIDLGKTKKTPVNLSEQLPSIPKETLPPNLDAASTLHKFFETLRSNDPYGVMYYMSKDLLAAVQKSEKADQPNHIIDSCRAIKECHALISTTIIGKSFSQTAYHNKVGQQGLTLGYDLESVNKNSAKQFPAGTSISFSLIPYTVDNNTYWAIDNIRVGEVTLR